ncbi:hypothetical protein [Vibrio phage PH669]|uniref:Uncharacterized protein n=1 Tax=Vibrio phage PH669 TaxID=2800823 RepID=A0A7T7CLB1_9CAUD|nr:hypothetical protein [Vibrio phage PH669]
MDINKLKYCQPAIEELLSHYNWYRCDHTGMLSQGDYDEEALADDVHNTIDVCCTGALKYNVSDDITVWKLCDAIVTLVSYSGLLFIHYTVGQEVDLPA